MYFFRHEKIRFRTIFVFAALRQVYAENYNQIESRFSLRSRYKMFRRYVFVYVFFCASGVN